jgi:hypothetical protein
VLGILGENVGPGHQAEKDGDGIEVALSQGCSAGTPTVGCQAKADAEQNPAQRIAESHAFQSFNRKIGERDPQSAHAPFAERKQ